jgi:hypothetical protein
VELTLTFQSIDRRSDMTTSNSNNDPKNATTDEATITDLPESKESKELTPDEDKNVVGGAATSGFIKAVVRLY